MILSYSYGGIVIFSTLHNHYQIVRWSGDGQIFTIQTVWLQLPLYKQPFSLSTLSLGVLPEGHSYFLGSLCFSRKHTHVRVGYFPKSTLALSFIILLLQWV